MKRLLICLMSVVTFSLVNAANYCASSSWGYAGTSVTGGSSATPTLVSSVSELKSAIGGKTPKNKVVIITTSLTFTSMLTMQDASNITILALPGVILKSDQQDATNSGILFIKRSSNIIIRNITFEGPGAYDCDGNDLLCFEKVTNAWVDHCDFQDGCDGNFDMKGTTDNITVSWCRFRYLKAPKAGGKETDDHRFTNLLGSSASDKPTDGTYNITWAFNWWDQGCVERMVRCRNAELHFLNCYWNSSVANYYVGPENAACYFEGCTFEGKANTTKLIYKSYNGTSNACKFVNCTGKLPADKGTVNAPTYAYDHLSAADAKTMVTNSECGAGATLVVNNKGEVGSSCDSGTTPDPDPQDPDPEEPITSDLTWDFSTSAFKNLGTISATITINDLTIAAASGKEVTVAEGAKTIDGIKFTHVLKTGGAGSAAARSLSFEVNSPCMIEVYLISASTTSERTLNVFSGSYGGTPFATLPATTTGTKQSFEWTGYPTTIYLGSANSGINLYAINVRYYEVPPEPMRYTLSYDENGGSGEMESQTVIEGESVTVQANAFTAPAGYSFKEWNTNAKGSGTKYNVGQSVTMNDDLKLYAVWAPNTYTVTLDADGGEGGTASVQVVFDDPMPNITIPSRTNYTFLGYFSEANGEGTQYYDANGSSTNSWITPADATLTAAWEEQGGDTPTPETGDLHFWFFNEADATANGLTNDQTVFSNMAAAGSDLAGSITIDGKSYTITRRTGDNTTFGTFTIPTNYKAVFYALAVSGGAGNRQINLVCGDKKYVFEVPGGSKTFQRLESEELPAGTYSIEREGTGSVRMGIVVLKFITDAPTAIENVPTATPARKIIREGRLLILRDNKTYDVLGLSL